MTDNGAHSEGRLPFTVATTPTARGALTVAVAGEVDHVTVTDLADAFDKALEQTPDALLIDLGNVEFCGSTGLAQLIRLNSLCHTEGIDLRLKPSPSVRKVVTTAGLKDVLPLVNA